jgi:hypothetical protein
VAAPLSVLPSALPAYPDAASALARLQGFRAALHTSCSHRADALVDLADALLSTPGPVASLPHLSLEPAHRRGWGSLYGALPMVGWTPSGCETCWPATPWRVDSRSMRWT